jgi:hypothetical protein
MSFCAANFRFQTLQQCVNECFVEKEALKDACLSFIN